MQITVQNFAVIGRRSSEIPWRK